MRTCVGVVGLLVVAGTSLHAQVCYQFAGVPAPNAPFAFSTFIVQVKIANPSLLSIGGILEGGFTGPDNSYSVTVDQTTQTFNEFQVTILNNPSALGSTTTVTFSGGTLGSSFAQILLSGDGNLLPSGLPQSLPPLSKWNDNNNFELSFSSKLYQGTITSIAACGTPITPSSPPPAITAGGIVPVDSTSGTIESGEWVSIYGSNLATTTATWDGAFPTSLGGTSVTVDGKPAFLWFVSPTQINLQVPEDSATGTVPVVVTNAGGTATSTVALSQVAPSFSLLDAKHVAGIILRSDGSGAYGGGAYDILGPTGTSLGYATVAAKPGDNVTLFAVGLGPTNPHVPAGQPFSGSAPTTNPVTVRINNVAVTPSYSGETSAGLYQLNLTIPSGLGYGDLPIQATVGGIQTQVFAVMSLQDAPVNSGDSKLQSITFSSGAVSSGGSVTVVLTSTSPAPAGGLLVLLSSGSSALSVPGAVYIPAGSLTLQLPLTANLVTADQIVTVTGTTASPSGLTTMKATVTVLVPPLNGPLSQLIAVPVTFQPTGYPSISTSFSVIPNPDNGTFTVCVSGCNSALTFIGGALTNQDQTFTFNLLQAGANAFVFTGSSTGVLQISSASLTFTLNQTSASGKTTRGTLTGTLTVMGTPYPIGGTSFTLSGPLSSPYTETHD